MKEKKEKTAENIKIKIDYRSFYYIYLLQNYLPTYTYNTYCAHIYVCVY